jgi:hypothetical protein
MSEAILLLMIGLIGVVAYLLIRLLRIKQLQSTDYDYLALLPEHNATFDLRTARAIITKITEAISMSTSVFKVAGIRPQVSFSLRSDKKNGARLIIAIPRPHTRMATDIILGSTHKIQVQKLEPDELQYFGPKKTSYFRLKNHYSLPFISEYSKEDVDRLESIIGSLDNIKLGDTISLNLKVSKTSLIRSSRLKNRLLGGETPILFSNTLGGHSLAFMWSVIKFIVSVLRSLIYLIELTFGSTKARKDYQKPPILVDKDKVVQQLDKLYDELFKTSISLTINCADQAHLKHLRRQLSLAVTAASKSRNQELVKTIGPLASYQLMSATEIASFFHLPEHDDLRHLYSKSSYKQLPPHKAELKRSKLDILLGSS